MRLLKSTTHTSIKKRSENTFIRLATRAIIVKDKNILLDNWKEKFIESKKYSSIIESVKAGIPSIISCYRKAASNTNIPDEYYLSFIEAMRKDIEISENNSEEVLSNAPDKLENYFAVPKVIE